MTTQSMDSATAAVTGGRSTQGQCIGAMPKVQRYRTTPRTKVTMLADYCRTCVSRASCPVALLITAKSELSNSLLLHSHVLKKEDYVFYVGDVFDALYVVKSGSIKTYLTSETGDEHVVTFYMPGDVLGVDALGRNVHTSSAVAMEASGVCRVPLAQLEKLAEHSLGLFFRLVYGELTRDQQRLLMLIKKGAESRLAGFLIGLSERFEARGYSPREFNLSMVRQDIGNHLGMSVETVSRLFTRMQKDGLLDVDRRHVTIRDLDSLYKLAGLEQARG